MNDPLTTIDAEVLEKNVMDSFKTMHKSVKIFSEIPGRDSHCIVCLYLAQYFLYYRTHLNCTLQPNLSSD